MNTKTWIYAVLACLLFSTTAGAMLLCLKYGVSPAVVLVAVMGCGSLAYLVIRTPAVLLVIAMFAPQWKTYWPFSYAVGSVDLTLVMLVCLAAYLTIRFLSHIGRLDQWGIDQLFCGQGKTIVAYILFGAVLAASYTYTTAPEYGMSKLLRFLGIGPLFLISPLFLIRSEEEFDRFARLFVTCSAVTVFQLIIGLETHDSNSDITRIGAGWLVGMAVVIILFYPLFRSESIQRVFLLCSMPLFVAGLIAAAARGPLVVLSVVSLIRLFLWFREGRQQTAIILVVVVMASGAAAYYALRDASEGKYVNKTRELVELLEGNETRGSATTRLQFYGTALSAIPDALFLGHGVGSWSVYYFGHDERAYPHNMFLEVAFEEGLFGLTSLCLLLAAVGASIYWLVQQRKSQYLVLGVIVFYCLGVGMFSGDLDDNRLLWVWIGMTMAICRTVRLEQLGPVPSAVNAGLSIPSPASCTTIR